MDLQQHLEEQIEKDLKLLKEYEDKLRCEDDPRHELKWRSGIKDLRQKIREDEKELRELKSEENNSSFSRNQFSIGNEGVNIKTPVSNSFSQKVQSKSSKEIDYTPLRDLLAAEKWREADEETARVMLKFADWEDQLYLDCDDIKKFPCKDLYIIDQFWVKYSKGNCGFSVQKGIYFELGGAILPDEKIWKAFGDRVGWRVDGKWLNYEDFTFSLVARAGHLPLCKDILFGGQIEWALSSFPIGSHKKIQVPSIAYRLANFNI